MLAPAGRSGRGSGLSMHAPDPTPPHPTPPHPERLSGLGFRARAARGPDGYSGAEARRLGEGMSWKEEEEKTKA